MAIGTYSELLAAISTWMIRSDMTTLAPQFVEMAEGRFNRTLRVPEMETVAPLVAVADAPTASLQADFLQARSLYLDTEPQVALEQVGIAQLAAVYGTGIDGSPTHYALQSGNEIVFGPTPDEDYDLILNYYAKIPALSDAAPTNWLLTSHPDLYLAAALAEGFAYTVDATRGPYWEGRTVQKLDELRRQGLKKAYSAAPLRASLRTGSRYSYL